jgi:hypothetical protein
MGAQLLFPSVNLTMRGARAAGIWLHMDSTWDRTCVQCHVSSSSTQYPGTVQTLQDWRMLTNASRPAIVFVTDAHHVGNALKRQSSSILTRACWITCLAWLAKIFSAVLVNDTLEYGSAAAPEVATECCWQA